MTESKTEVPSKAISPAKKLMADVIKAVGLVIFFCGLPGICVALLTYFIFQHVSYERKQEVIDAMKLIVENDKVSVLFLYLIIGLIGVVFIYKSYWKGREKLLMKRVKEPERSSKINHPESI